MYIWAQIPEPYRAMGSLSSPACPVGCEGGQIPGIGFGEYGDEYVRFALIENEQRTAAGARHQGYVPQGTVCLNESDEGGPVGPGRGGRRSPGRCWRVMPKKSNRRAGRRIEVSRIAVRDVAKARSRVGDGVEISTDGFALVRDPAVDIVVELIGGDTLARERVLEAIAQGKHIVTANKALLVMARQRIFAAASPAASWWRSSRGGRQGAEYQGDPRRPDRQPHRMGGRHHQRHHQFHPVRNAAPRAAVRRRAGGGAGAWATPRSTPPSTSKAWTPRKADPCWLCWPSACCGPVRMPRPMSRGITQLAQEDIAHAERLGYRIKLLGITKRRVDGIELRACIRTLKVP